MSNKLLNDITNDELGGLATSDEKNVNEHNLITRVLGDEVFDSAFEETVSRDYYVETVNVPLTLIRPRDFNGKILSEIEKLSNSIGEIGLIEPIVIFVQKKDDNKDYSISAGHRRFKAWSMLYEKAVAEGNEENIEKYKKIPARILTSGETENEDKFFKASNYYRDVTVFEKVYEYNPTRTMFEDENIKLDYIKLKYGEEGIAKYHNGDLKDKFNMNSLNDYIALMYKRDNINTEVTDKTISHYVLLAINASHKLTDAIFNTLVTPRQAREIATLTEQDQDVVVDMISTGISVSEAIAMFKKKTVTAEVEVDTKDMTDVEKLEATVKKLFKFKFNDIESIKNKELNGNQKEVLKQIKKVQKQIEILSEMPLK